MKKRIFSILFTLVLILTSIGDTYAQDRVSVDNMDETISIGGTITHNDGSLYGTKLFDGTYLENILPLNNNSLNIKATNKKSAFNNYTDRSLAINKTENSIIVTPNSEDIIIKWNDNKKRLFYSDINIEFIDMETGEIIARGFKLQRNKKYISAINVKNKKIKIKLKNNKKNINNLDIYIADSSNQFKDINTRISKFKTINSKIQTRWWSTYNIEKVWTDEKIPKNIDGYQGEQVYSNTLSSDSAGNGTVTIGFLKGENGMDEVNINIKVDDLGSVGYSMNVKRYTQVKTSTLPINTNYKVIMSTNSENQGKARLGIRHFVI